MTLPRRTLLAWAPAALWLPYGLAEGAQPAWPPRSVYRLDAPLTDQDGHALRWQDGVASAAAGQPRIVSMFYTRCDMVCPMLFEAIRGIEGGLPADARARLQVGLVSLDPARDDVAALKATAAQRGGDPARWRLYRAKDADVRKIAGVLGVRYRRLSSGEFNHSTPIILLDGQGVELARTENIAKPDAAFIKAVQKATQAGAGGA
jgi:protein SCO1/2